MLLGFKSAEALRKSTVEIGIDELIVCLDTRGQKSCEATMEGFRFFAAEVMADLKKL